MSRFPDAEAGAKAWLGAHLTTCSGRVFYGMPDGTPTFPLTTVELVSGGPDDDEAPTEQPRLSFSCWGKTKLEASEVKRELVGLLHGLRSTQLDDTTFCYEVLFIATQFLKDPDSKLRRYVVDATFVTTYRTA